mgnify:CR=1 FL=1
MKRYKKLPLLFYPILITLLFFINTSPAAAADMYLSDNDVSLDTGETVKVTAYNVSGDLYVSRNSNSRIVSVNINGRTISIRGRDRGESTIKICEDEGDRSCDTLYVDVEGSNYLDEDLDLRVSNLVLPLSSSVMISYDDSDDLYIAQNYDPSIVSVSYSSKPIGCTDISYYSVLTGEPCFSYYDDDNTSITIFALSVGVGEITICKDNRNECSRINVAVTSPYQANYQYYPYQYYPYYY